MATVPKCISVLCRSVWAACGCDQECSNQRVDERLKRVCGGRGLRLTQGGSPGYQRLADEDPQLRNDPAAQ